MWRGGKGACHEPVGLNVALPRGKRYGKPQEISVHSQAGYLNGTSSSNSNGISLHHDGGQAMMDSPKDVNGLQHFPGTSNYLFSFTPNLAEIVKPLTELTLKQTQSRRDPHSMTQPFKEPKL